MPGWDPDAVATLVAGAATLVAGAFAVGAAVWTLRDTRRSAWVNALENKLAVAKRTMVVFEVARDGIDAILNKPERYSTTLPWNAFVALASDIGALDIQQIHLYVDIKSCARQAEAAIKSRADKTPTHEELSAIRGLCETLRLSSARLVENLEHQLLAYYESPAFGRLPRPFEETDT